MIKANVRRMHTPYYDSDQFPPLPPRIRLATETWERVWWLTLSEPLDSNDKLQQLVQRFATDRVILKAQMRTQRRVCFAVTTQGLDEQSEFELAMMIMAKIHTELARIERVEDRPASVWPIDNFK